MHQLVEISIGYALTSCIIAIAYRFSFSISGLANLRHSSQIHHRRNFVAEIRGIGVPDDIAAGGEREFALKMQSQNRKKGAGKLL